MRRNLKLIQDGDQPSPPPAQPPPRGYWTYRTFDEDALETSSSSCCFWGVFVVFFGILLIMFLVYWLVPYPYPYYPPLPPPVKTTEGGQAVPGLGLGMGAVEDINRHDADAAACGPGEVHNTTSQACQMRVVYPSAVDGTLYNNTVNPCVSFYEHACGSWLAFNKNRLGAVKRIDRSFGYVQRQNKRWLKMLVLSRTDLPTHQFYAR